MEEKEEVIEIKEPEAKEPKKYFVSDSERVDRTFDLGALGVVKLVYGETETEVTKEQAEALKIYTYLQVSEK